MLRRGLYFHLNLWLRYAPTDLIGRHSSLQSHLTCNVFFWAGGYYPAHITCKRISWTPFPSPYFPFPTTRWWQFRLLRNGFAALMCISTTLQLPRSSLSPVRVCVVQPLSASDAACSCGRWWCGEINWARRNCWPDDAKKCHSGFECIVHKFECRMQQIFIQNQAVILYETLKGFKAIS